MLTSIGASARRWAASSSPWTNVYGLARTLLALSSALTLAFTPSWALFIPVYGGPRVHCESVTRLSAFCLAPSGSHELLSASMIAVLLVVASGWRPRWTAPAHTWIAFSMANGLSVVDGGDQVCLNLSLLLLPIALTDRRRWHWARVSFDERAPASLREEAQRLIAVFAAALIRIQVAAIYFHAAIGKFGVEDWTNGTAVYYFFGHSMFGAPSAVLAVLRPVLTNPVGVTAITWGTLLLEYGLSAALLMPKRHWRTMLWLGVSLHAGIIIVHGLLSFSIAMFAALVLYLQPHELPLRLPRWGVLRRLIPVGARCESGSRPGARLRAWE